MTKIMFVCHGNICRSPMAEFIFNDLAKKNRADKACSASSCAVSTEEIYCGIGNPVDRRAKEVLFRHGIKTEDRRAVLLKKEDLLNFDLFVCMDSSNYRRAVSILENEDKVVKFEKYIGRDVSDPWYTGDFEKAFKDIYEGCEKLIRLIKENAV